MLAMLYVSKEKTTMIYHIYDAQTFFILLTCFLYWFYKRL